MERFVRGDSRDAVTNLAAARIDKLGDIRLSANWMAAAGHPGEDARLFDTVHAVGMGCRVEHARSMVYSDGMDLENLDSAIPIGVTCRLCDRMDCTQRAVPPVKHTLAVDEDVRGPSFYAPVDPRV